MKPCWNWRYTPSLTSASPNGHSEIRLLPKNHEVVQGWVFGVRTTMGAAVAGRRVICATAVETAAEVGGVLVEVGD